jgi:Type I phosphodiesterase / nucleotide pyrophosphatase
MTRMGQISTLALTAIVLAACSDSKTPLTAPAAGAFAANASTRAATPKGQIKHVLLISVDGMHMQDLARYVDKNPNSQLARLSNNGITYGRVTGSKPSDSFPGTAALISGGTPAVTGIYYDVSYDRALSPPGSTCQTVGTTVTFDESLDIDDTRLDGGGGINVNNLPRDPNNGCKPVYPHSYLRTNTIFEVVHEAGYRTAYTDKHRGAYDLYNGPSGKGVDDLYSPEQAANMPMGGTGTTGLPQGIYFDSIRADYVLNEIRGFDHTGTQQVGVPTLFGMNFQVVSVVEKVNGYTDGNFTPSPNLQSAFDYVDHVLGKWVKALSEQGLYGNTLIVVAAKHGQSATNPALRRIVDPNLAVEQIDSVAPNLVGNADEDDAVIVWLTNQQLTAAAVDKLAANQSSNHIAQLYWGSALTAGNTGFPGYPSPLLDSRVPDIIGVSQKGVVYDTPGSSKMEEHGGFADDDTWLGLVIFIPGLPKTDIETPVETRQVAPTILDALGLSPFALDAARLQGTQVLPGFDAAISEWLEGQVHYFQLVDASGTPISGYSPLADGQSIPVSTLGSGVMLQAVTYPSTIGSVGFVDGSFSEIVNASPYEVPLSDFKSGSQSLRAVPWSGKNAGGTGGVALTLNFTLK